MTCLSDRSIRKAIGTGHVVVDPYNADMVQPASLDLALEHRFCTMDPGRCVRIDPFERQDRTKLVELKAGESFVLHPGDFVLGSILELIELPDDVCGRVEGKSSVGRLGLLIHVTPGFIDPGFRGKVTLELSNLTRLPILLWPGMKICQLSLMWLDEPAERPYGERGLTSKHVGQDGPQPSLYWMNSPPPGYPYSDEKRNRYV